MALTIHVAGPVHIKPAFGNATNGVGSLESLGYSEAGLDITENVMTLDVHGDQNGGEAGTPIDIQYMDEYHVIRMTLTKWDEVVINKVRATLPAATVGTTSAAGTLLFQGFHCNRLLLLGTAEIRNYLRVVFREPKEINKGSKHSKAMLVAHCYKDASGVLYNEVTT